MATSTCIKCGNTRFEIKETVLQGAKYKVYLVQCSSCGGVIGALEYFASGVLIHELAKKLNVKLDG